MAALTEQQFRDQMPEFCNAIAHPSEKIVLYAALADKACANEQRWGAFRDQGMRLYIAHHLALDAMNRRAAKNGIPGVGGAVASKSLGQASMSFDTQLGTAANGRGGVWNMTIYGKQYYQLVLLVGAGPLHSN